MKSRKILIACLWPGVVLLSSFLFGCSCDKIEKKGPPGPDGWDYDMYGDPPDGYDYVAPDSPIDMPPDDGPETEICDEEEFNITHVTPDMLIVLDRSNSMKYNGFWIPTREAVVSIALTYQATVLFGLMVFPDTSCINGMPSQCNPGAAPVVEVALNNGENIRAALLSMSTCGGTPIARTLANAHTYLIDLPDTNPKYVLLATDGEFRYPTYENGPSIKI